MPREPAPDPGRGTSVIVQIVEKISPSNINKQNLSDLLTDRFCLFIFDGEQMCIMFAETESPWVAYCEMVYKNVY